MPAKINTIKVHDSEQPTPPIGEARLFSAYVAEPDAPRGEYDGRIDLLVTNPHGYVSRADLRKVARRELRRIDRRAAQVRRIQRVW